MWEKIRNALFITVTPPLLSGKMYRNAKADAVVVDVAVREKMQSI